MISDGWRPTAPLEILQLRARMLSRIRAFFAARDVMEVETPVLSRAAVTDPNLVSFSVAAGPHKRFLHTSPEFPMKRLLAAGSGNIYQICKVFRAEEAGRYHNPEFSILEWYRVGFDHLALMDETEALLGHIFQGLRAPGPVGRLTYREAWLEFARLDGLTASSADCAAVAARHGIEAQDDLDRRQWLELIMSHVVVPACSREGFAFIYDFPADQAALARIRPDQPPVAERFELLGYGVELANGFHELTDTDEQRERFKRELDIRRQRDAAAMPLDDRLLAALAHGLPDCSGVAVGLDRLVMLAANLDHISAAMAFSWGNA